MSDQVTLTTPEGVTFRPIMHIKQEKVQLGDDVDPDAPYEVTELVVGVEVSMPDGQKHTVKLIPSTATDEGYGHGNVFVYVDDEAVSHFAWEAAPSSYWTVTAAAVLVDRKISAGKLLIWWVDDSTHEEGFYDDGEFGPLYFDTIAEAERELSAGRPEDRKYRYIISTAAERGLD